MPHLRCPCQACASSVYTASNYIDRIWLFAVILRFINLYIYGQGCTSRGFPCCLCCCTGIDRAMPRWAILQSNFLSRAFRPIFLVLLLNWIINTIMYDQHDDANFYIASVVLIPVRALVACLALSRQLLLGGAAACISLTMLLSLYRCLSGTVSVSISRFSVLSSWFRCLFLSHPFLSLMYFSLYIHSHTHYHLYLLL